MSPGMREKLVAAGVLGTVLLVGSLVVVPDYRSCRDMDRAVVALRAKIAGLDSSSAQVRRLRRSVSIERAAKEATCRRVPGTPGVAELIRSMPCAVDGVEVIDRTFSAGGVIPVPGARDVPFDALPLAIELEGTFDSAFRILRHVESLDHLVRVSSVRLSRSSEREDLLQATLSLHVIFEQEGGS